MEQSGEIYEELMLQVEGLSGEIAQQLRAEVTRGRLVRGFELSARERRLRDQRITDTESARIGRADVAVIEYDGDQRLRLLCEALVTAARTMAASRRALIGLLELTDLSGNQIVFADEDDPSPRVLNIGVQAREAEWRRGIVEQELAPLQQELSSWL
ncbi:hypothetical protein FF36_02513 [Frankia torreyi]|uniref:Uncharacterized protein n=1 Tax=Frankia torreyi TaxID=1856 RepID=A0A0D8BG97_9ACTN|nr:MULTISPECIES: hypothetical protein [Frankia]KJE23085.1 hypothetical protein FF36_02513 [Frankia torreyi]